MPLPGARYRYKKGTDTRLAFNKENEVVEAKNMKTGATHTPDEFEKDEKRMMKSSMPKPPSPPEVPNIRNTKRYRDTMSALKRGRT